jgi:hypothetical protein
MKRLFATSAVPNEVAANVTGGDDWRLERLLNRLPVFARPFASSGSHPPAGSGFQQEHC